MNDLRAVEPHPNTMGRRITAPVAAIGLVAAILAGCGQAEDEPVSCTKVSSRGTHNLLIDQTVDMDNIRTTICNRDISMGEDLIGPDGLRPFLVEDDGRICKVAGFWSYELFPDPPTKEELNMRSNRVLVDCSVPVVA